MRQRRHLQRDFIVFGEDFHRHPHALEHLLRPLFGSSRFLWVETIGLRSPRWSAYDLRRSFEKVRKWIGAFLKPEKMQPVSGVFVLRPVMLPFSQFRWVRWLNCWSVRFSIERALQKHDFMNVVSVASVPNACDFIGKFDEKSRIYFCVDEFSLWPGIPRELAQEMEKKLIKNVDQIIATSEVLAKSKLHHLRQTRLLTHGVEFNHFNIGPRRERSGNWKICYFGLFDERTNQDLLRDMATELPQAEIHIIGRVVCDTKALAAFKNIFFDGPSSYDVLPQRIQEMDIFILPYARNNLTENINPLKLKEYLATGRPVIATSLPEVRVWKEHLFIAETSSEFVEYIKKIMNGEISLRSEETQKLLRESETWEAKTFELSEIIEDLEGEPTLAPSRRDHNKSCFK